MIKLEEAIQIILTNLPYKNILVNLDENMLKNNPITSLTLICSKLQELNIREQFQLPDEIVKVKEEEEISDEEISDEEKSDEEKSDEEKRSWRARKKLECEKLLNRMVKPNRIVQGEIYQGEVPNFRTSKDDFDSIRVSKKRRN